MSELTKIFSILLKNLSDALLTTASELSKLDTPETFTQADDKPPLLAQKTPQLITRYQYEKGEKVMVIFDGATTPTRCNIVKRVDMNTYTVHPYRSPKSESREINVDQILGLDPNR